MQMKQTIAFTYDFKACILLGIRHLQFSFLDFDMYFCISPDIHISIPMTVSLEIGCLTSRGRGDEYCSKCEA